MSSSRVLLNPTLRKTAVYSLTVDAKEKLILLNYLSLALEKSSYT
jgi:hypothetical protein